MRVVRVGCLLLLLLAAACADPVDEPREQGRAASEPLGARAPEPADEDLRAEVAGLGDLLVDAAERLAAAADAGTLAGVRHEAEGAIALLIGDPPGGGAPLFPVERGERGSGTGREDRLTRTATLAREAGGEEGRAVRELLRDPVAGELGAWQRDPGGMIAMAREAARPDASLQAVERDVFELPGEATRALAWAMLARDAEDLARATDYAARGAAHLRLGADAVDELAWDER